MNITSTSKNEVKTAYKTIIAKEKEMKLQAGNDKYYAIQNELKDLLSDFVKLDFNLLSTAQLLKICALIGSHRPFALHTFFIYCSKLIAE